MAFMRRGREPVVAAPQPVNPYANDKFAAYRVHAQQKGSMNAPYQPRGMPSNGMAPGQMGPGIQPPYQNRAPQHHNSLSNQRSTQPHHNYTERPDRVQRHGPQHHGPQHHGPQYNQPRQGFPPQGSQQRIQAPQGYQHAPRQAAATAVSQDVTNQQELESQNGHPNQPHSNQYEESYQEFKARRMRESQEKKQRNAYSNPSYNADDLNAVDQPDYDDLNNDVSNYGYKEDSSKKMSSLYSDEEEEDDEELEDIKGELRFTRDKTIESTERTLRMAREAEQSGQNTMGMLGSQSARLFDTENKLQVSQTSAEIGNEIAKELRTVSNIFKAPANPFNKKSRLRKKEESQNLRLLEEQNARDEKLKEYQDSERRVKDHLGQTPGNPYSQQRQFKKASEAQYKQYSYEGEGSYARKQEDTINNNIDEIHGYAKRLRGLANAQAQEIDRQDFRLKNMGEDMSSLHLTVDQATTRLNRVIH